MQGKVEKRPERAAGRSFNLKPKWTSTVDQLIFLSSQPAPKQDKTMFSASHIIQRPNSINYLLPIDDLSTLCRWHYER